MSVIQKGMPYQFNSDMAIMFTDSKQVKTFQGYQDLASMNAWYEEDPDKSHLGLQKFFINQGMMSTSIFPELLEKKQVLEVNGFDGTFTYSIPVFGEKGIYTVRDLSEQIKPGIDESTFKIALNKQFEPGDILSYDVEYGQQLYVTEDIVDVDGDAFIHTVALVTNDKADYYLAANLAKGIEYYKVGHTIFGEYGTNYSAVQMPDTVGEMKLQFQLGNLKGVQAYYTGMADSKSFGGATAATKDYLDTLSEEASRMGELAVLMNVGSNGKPTLRGAKIGSTLQLLVMRELERLTAQQLLWQRAATIRTSNGVARLNEGLWHQLRRGKKIKYSRPGGITKSHIREAVEYVFRGNPELTWEDRVITFEVGEQALYNVLEIFRDEVNAQMASNVTFIQSSGGNILPKSTVSSQDGTLQELELDWIRFTSVMLPGIGRVKIKHNKNLDYTISGMVDRFSRGFHKGNKAHTTYSMLIWDATDQKYSNNKQIPEGATLAEGADGGANVYLVKPQGEMTYWGTENGRYHPYKAGDIVSSQKQIAASVWAWNACAIHVMDLSRFVIIELNESSRKAYS